MAEEIDRDQGAGLEIVLPRRIERGGEALRVEVIGRFVDLGEDRRRAHPGHHLGGRGKGEARADHRVAGADAERLEHQNQRVRAIGDADRMLRPAERGKPGLELTDLLAEDVVAIVDDLQDRFVHGLADMLALGFEVDEFDRGTLAHQTISSRVSGPVSR